MAPTGHASRSGAPTKPDIEGKAARPIGSSSLARAVADLTRSVAELVNGRRDDVIAALVDSRGPADDSLHVRRAAEHAAYTLCIKRDGIDIHEQLFIVEIVLAFDDEIPVTQIDPLLLGVLQSRALRMENEATARRGSFDDTLLLGEVFELEDLGTLPLSRVHQDAVAMSAGK